MEIRSEFPKAWEKYKSYLVKKYGKEGDELMAKFITDETLELNLKSVPMSALFYFDTLDQIGAVCYNGLEQRFEISVNGVAIDEENPDVAYEVAGSKDRREAENLLIYYLFSEQEKTL